MIYRMNIEKREMIPSKFRILNQNIPWIKVITNTTDKITNIKRNSLKNLARLSW
jgi:hypothetical protein